MLEANDQRAAESPFIDFAHGTSLEDAEEIARHGLDEERARSRAQRGRLAQPGAWFAHRIDPKRPGAAVQGAYEFGLRKAERPVVLVGRLPSGIYGGLRAAGLVRLRPLPGTMPEVIFRPEAFGLLNRHMRWSIIDPYGRLDEHA